MVPVVLALAVGLHDGIRRRLRRRARADRPRPSPRGAAGATPPAPAGQEFTESAGRASPAAAGRQQRRTGAGTPRRQALTSASPTPEADGRLLVRSTPAGALVFVDGQEYGLTPVAVRDLAHGGHRVRVVRDGYVAEERRVVITAVAAVAVADDRARAAGAAAPRARATAPTPPAARRARPRAASPAP